MLRRFSFLVAIILILMLVALAGIGFFIRRPAGTTEETIAFTVSSGEGVWDIGRNLQASGLIRSSAYFVWRVSRRAAASRLQAGDYALSPSWDVETIISHLAQGEVSGKERALRIIEGWNNREIGAYIEQQGMATADEFHDFATFPIRELSSCLKPSDCNAYEFLRTAPEQATLEGFLFPDTYRVYTDASVRDIVVKMLDNFDRKLTPELRAEIKRQGKSAYEIVTLASIIEKEVRTAEDMKRAASVFYNRLEVGMPLQSDATLTYYFDNNKIAHSGKELEVETPYNTYKYKGLPPTPIANPGMNAILAAVYPAQSDYVYFLSDPKTGKTYFSETLEEHNRNKAQYLQ